MIEESKYCSDVMKNHFNKILVMTKGDNEDFHNSTNVGSVIMIILILMSKQEIIVILMKNIEALHIEIVISILD